MGLLHTCRAPHMGSISYRLYLAAEAPQEPDLSDGLAALRNCNQRDQAALLAAAEFSIAGPDLADVHHRWQTKVRGEAAHVQLLSGQSLLQLDFPTGHGHPCWPGLRSCPHPWRVPSAASAQLTTAQQGCSSGYRPPKLSSAVLAGCARPAGT